MSGQTLHIDIRREPDGSLTVLIILDDYDERLTIPAGKNAHIKVPLEN